MTKIWKGKRFISLVLSLALLVSMLPPLALPANSVEVPQEDTPQVEEEVQYNSGVYGALIGAAAEPNWEEYRYLVISDDPTIAMVDGQELVATDAWGIPLVVEDVHWVAEDTSLWLKVAAAEGYTLPEQLQQYPWVFQNYTDVYGDAVLEAEYPDSLLLTLPNKGQMDMATGVTVSGADLPENAVLSVSVPTIGGEPIPGVFDIKVYDEFGNEWQPIDEGKTVNITMPTQYEVVKVTHIMDYADAILGREDLAFVPVADIDAETLALLEPAIDAYAQVYNNRDYVAVEELGPFTAENGMVSVAANSFSIYVFLEDEYRNAGTDWESYIGYSTTNEAMAASAAGTAFVYYIRVGTELTWLFSKGLTANVKNYYEISSDDGKHGTYVTGPTGSGFGVKGTKDVKFTIKDAAEAVARKKGSDEPGYRFYIRYTNNGKPAHNVKTVVFEIISKDFTDDELKSDNTPLYIGVHIGDSNVFPIEPTMSVTGTNYRWYLNGGFNKTDEQYPHAYTSYANSIVYTKKYQASFLKEEIVGATAIVDHSGINTMSFISLDKSFVNEILEKMTSIVSGVSSGTHTILVYAIKYIDNSGTYPGYYIMCKAIPQNAKIVSYYPNVPQGFSAIEDEVDGYIPGVSIVTAESQHTVAKLVKTEFELPVANGVKPSIKFVGWSTDPNAHWEDYKNVTEIIDGEWYPAGESFVPQGNMQLYAVWENTMQYTEADVEFHYSKLDENGNFLVDDTGLVTFEVDLVDYTKYPNGASYTIYNELGISQSNATFDKDHTTFQLRNGWFIRILDLQNNETPYTIEYKSSIEGYAPDDGSVTQIWITETNNISGEFIYDFTIRKQQYTLTWDVDGNKDSVKYYYGATVTPPANPTKEHYDFAGWYFGDEEVDFTTTQTMPASDVTLVAKWTPYQYKITYNLAGGSGVSQSGYYDIEHALELPTPTKQNFIFAGWKPLENSGNWEMGTTYSSTFGMYGDVILEAQWEAKTFTITYELAGGVWPAGDFGPGGYDLNDTIILPTPIRTGYTFIGWTGTDLSGLTMEVTIPAGSSGDRSYTANWEINQYTIIFADTGDTTIAPIKQDYGTAITAPENPTRKGYTFVGWDKTVPDQMPAENLTITAQWKINQYTITYVLNNGRPDVVQTYDYGATITAPNNPSKANYIFRGWNPSVPDTMSAEDLIVEAIWGSLEYTITWKNWDGTALGTSTVAYGATPTYTGATPTKTETGYTYTFNGWNPEVVPVTGNAEYTAQFIQTINTYTITYNLDGGTNHGTNPATYTVEETITLQDPTKDGYNFLGWYTDERFTNRISQISGSTGNLTLYAKWEAALASLTIDVKFANDASKDEEQTFIFHVTGDGVDVTVVVQGSGQVVIAGLTIGKQYIITPKSEWSWRYGAMGTTTVEITVGGSTATFEVNRSKTQWLDSNAYYKNQG